MFERTSAGLDVHARTVVSCAMDAQTGEIILQRMTPDHGEILASILSLPSPADPPRHRHEVGNGTFWSLT